MATSSHSHFNYEQDEFHQRLKFNRRGLVGMANGGKNDNGSQFFITLGRADELNNKNTLFGKVRMCLINMGVVSGRKGEGLILSIKF